MMQTPPEQPMSETARPAEAAEPEPGLQHRRGHRPARCRQGDRVPERHIGPAVAHGQALAEIDQAGA